MAAQPMLLSPAELAYLHSSLSLKPPIRPDGRSPTQFRPLIAETGFLPGTNGSARVRFADGTEAIVGVKAEIEKSTNGPGEELDGGTGAAAREPASGARGDWLEMAVEVPGQRDDEAATVFLEEMLREALLADGQFAKKLWINNRFHWRLYLDVRAPYTLDRLCLSSALSSSFAPSSFCNTLHSSADSFFPLFVPRPDSARITAAVLPLAAALPHHTPGPPLHQVAPAEI